MKRRLLIDPGGLDTLDEAAATAVDHASITPAAWERFTAASVWCSLSSVGHDRRALHCTIAEPYAVLEVEIEAARELELVLATEALGRFWKLCGLWSVLPRAPGAVPPGLYDAVAALSRGEEADVAGLPRMQRLRLGRGPEVEQEDFLIDDDGAWLRCRLLELEEEGPMVLVEPFSMKQHVVEFSALLAFATLRD